MRNDRQTISESQSSLIQQSNGEAFLTSDQSFKEFIKSNLKRPKVSKEFIQSIKEKIKVA